MAIFGSPFFYSIVEVMKYLSLSIFGMMLLVMLGYMNAADQLLEADLLEEQRAAQSVDPEAAQEAAPVLLVHQAR